MIKVLLIFFAIAGLLLLGLVIVIALFLRQVNKNGWNN